MENTISIHKSIVQKAGFWLIISWCRLGLAFLLILLIEIPLHAIRRLTSWGDDPRVYADAFSDSQWAREYLAELDSWSYRWSPFVDWVSKPMKTKYINIDSDGARVTWNHGLTRGSAGFRSVRIFMFGGSTMAGMGADDDETIPSYFVRLLDEKRISAQVTNFGCPGYILTQSLLTLMNQLAKGNKPDLVIFYGGINEVSAAYRDTISTGDNAPSEREIELIKGSDRQLWIQALLALSRHSILFAEAQALAQGALGTLRRPRISSPSADARQIDTALGRYLGDKKFVEALGTRFGFRSLFFWQPVLFSKKPLSAYESRIVDHEPAGMKRFFMISYASARSRLSSRGVIDISDVFDNANKPYFIDESHLAGAGNEVVARRMLTDIEKSIEEFRGYPSAKLRSAVVPAIPTGY